MYIDKRTIEVKVIKLDNGMEIDAPELLKFIDDSHDMEHTIG